MQLSFETLLLLLRLLNTREEPVLYELVLKDLQATKEAPPQARTPRAVSDAYVQPAKRRRHAPPCLCFSWLTLWPNLHVVAA